MPEPVLRTRGLTRKFGDFVAVDGLDLEVPRGTFFGFLGPNGAGKSTTIKMLTGLLKASSGSASLLGFDVASEATEVKRRIGVVPEDLALFDRLTAAEHLTFVGRMYGMARPEIARRADELLELMELDANPSKLVVDLSHGMKKKLAISSALIHGPELLFLDEPFEGIDAISSRLIKDILDSLVRSGVTIFLTSHILEIAEKLCSDLAVIDHGKLVAQGSLAALSEGVGLLKEGGRETNLEEVFLSIVGGRDSGKRTLSWLA